MQFILIINLSGTLIILSDLQFLRVLAYIYWTEYFTALARQSIYGHCKTKSN